MHVTSLPHVLFSLTSPPHQKHGDGCTDKRDEKRERKKKREREKDNFMLYDKHIHGLHYKEREKGHVKVVKINVKCNSFLDILVSSSKLKRTKI